MAQRTIHYVLGELLLRECPVRDRKRFLLGSILPDAYSAQEERKLAHFTDRSTPGIMFFDFDAFRRRFGDRMAADDLYLGYYMHLVEDACYRIFWQKVRLFERDMTREKVAILHNDYHLLNAYIVSRYHIRDELVWPEGFESEPVNRIYPFLLRDFLSEMRGDFTEHPEGTTVYMTEALLEEYLSDTRGVCRDALRRILTGGEPLDPMSLTW